MNKEIKFRVGTRVKIIEKTYIHYGEIGYVEKFVESQHGDETEYYVSFKIGKEQKQSTFLESNLEKAPRPMFMKRQVVEKSFERKGSNYTGLPDGMNIWHIKSDSNDDRHLVRVGTSYESAMSVIIDSKNPLPVQVSDSPEYKIEYVLDSYDLKSSDWSAVRKFIMEHDWLLKEACIGHIDSSSIHDAMSFEEYFNETISYGLLQTGEYDV